LKLRPGDRFFLGFDYLPYIFVSAAVLDQHLGQQSKNATLAFKARTGGTLKTIYMTASQKDLSPLANNNRRLLPLQRLDSASRVGFVARRGRIRNNGALPVLFDTEVGQHIDLGSITITPVEQNDNAIADRWKACTSTSLLPIPTKDADSDGMSNLDDTGPAPIPPTPEAFSAIRRNPCVNRMDSLSHGPFHREGRIASKPLLH
jgi:hypothetical protein